MNLAEHLREHRAQLEGDFVVAVEAQRFVEMMEADHPGALEEWYRTHAVRYVAIELGRIDRNARARLASTDRHRAFTQGESEALGLFATTFVVDEKFTRRPLGDMTARDLVYRAELYEGDARQKQAMAAFLRALAKKAGTKQVRQVITEARAEEMLRSFLGNAATAA